jgi:hypothetical protein
VVKLNTGEERGDWLNVPLSPCPVISRGARERARLARIPSWADEEYWAQGLSETNAKWLRLSVGKTIAFWIGQTELSRDSIALEQRLKLSE